MRVRRKENFQEIAKDGLLHEGLLGNPDFYVFGVDDEYYTLINNAGEPIMYPKELFEVLDRSIPSGWCFHQYEDGGYLLEPARTSKPGFYEDWHGSDGDEEAEAAARKALRAELERTAAEVDETDRALIVETLRRLKA